MNIIFSGKTRRHLFSDKEVNFSVSKINYKKPFTLISATETNIVRSWLTNVLLTIYDQWNDTGGLSHTFNPSSSNATSSKNLVEQVSFDEYPILMVSFLDKTNKSTDHHFGGRPNRAKLAKMKYRSRSEIIELLLNAADGAPPDTGSSIKWIPAGANIWFALSTQLWICDGIIFVGLAPLLSATLIAWIVTEYLGEGDGGRISITKTTPTYNR